MNEMKTLIFFCTSLIAMLLGIVVFLGNLNKILECYTTANIFFVCGGLLLVALGATGCCLTLLEIDDDEERRDKRIGTKTGDIIDLGTKISGYVALACAVVLGVLKLMLGAILWVEEDMLWTHTIYLGFLFLVGGGVGIFYWKDYWRIGGELRSATILNNWLTRVDRFLPSDRIPIGSSKEGDKGEIEEGLGGMKNGVNTRKGT